MYAPTRFSLKIVQTSRRLASGLTKTQIKPKKIRENRAKPAVEKHLLKNLFPWKTKEELVDHLTSNVIYNKDGLVVINKPYGIPLRRTEQVVGCNESLFTIEDILSPLAFCLKEKTLLPAKVGEKFSSGLSIFATDSEVVEKLQKSYRVNKTEKINTFTYQTITIGQPIPEKGTQKVAMGFFSHKDIEKKFPVIVKEHSVNQVKRDLVKLYNVDFRTLETSKTCSLVELNVSSANKHFLRVYLAHRLAPILGDHLFGNRVREIMGKRLAINPVQADNLSNFQKIPEIIVSSLNLEDSGQVPTCLHLNKIVLSRFDKGSSLELTADLPAHFNFIMKAVRLMRNYSK